MVLGQNQANQRPAVLAFGGGGPWSAALHPAQLLRQAQEAFAQNRASQPIAAALQRLRISARLQREGWQLGMADISISMRDRDNTWADSWETFNATTDMRPGNTVSIAS